MNVTLRQLRVFIEVARLESFSRAGDEIGLTQSAVSRCVRELEVELGLRLVDRTTREVRLTDAGANLRGSVSRLLSDLDQVLHEIREIGKQRRGRCALRPAVSVHPARAARRRAKVRKVKSGEVDFGVIVGALMADELVGEPLMTDSFCVVCPASHRLAAGVQVRWSALAGESLVLLGQESGSRPIIDRVLREHGVASPVVQELGHSATVFGLVEAGVGISVLPWLSLPLPVNSGLVARALVPRAQRTVELVRRRERSLSPAAQAVWELVRALPARAEDLA
ncbi:hypothetical protein DFQ30_000902 [Apophysomyces sp. BC1015]|nr:hypothetical protein DFQ30_000902 [Apophysomyces sp. BC1015]